MRAKATDGSGLPDRQGEETSLGNAGVSPLFAFAQDSPTYLILNSSKKTIFRSVLEVG
jgi:hypothetical protein